MDPVDSVRAREWPIPPPITPEVDDNDDVAERESGGIARTAEAVTASGKVEGLDCGPPRGEASLIPRRRGEEGGEDEDSNDEDGAAVAVGVVAAVVGVGVAAVVGVEVVVGGRASSSEALTTAARRASSAPVGARGCGNCRCRRETFNSSKSGKVSEWVGGKEGRREGRRTNISRENSGSRRYVEVCLCSNESFVQRGTM